VLLAFALPAHSLVAQVGMLYIINVLIKMKYNARVIWTLMRCSKFVGTSRGSFGRSFCHITNLCLGPRRLRETSNLRTITLTTRWYYASFRIVVHGKAAYIDGIGPATPYAGMYGEWEIANPGKRERKSRESERL